MAEQPGNGEKETRKAWDEVGRHFSQVGRQFGQHYRRLASEASASATEQREAMNDALKKAVDQLDQAFTSVGDALRDPETQEGLKHAARSLRDAVGTTFSDFQDEIRKHVRRKGPGPHSTG